MLFDQLQSDLRTALKEKRSFELGVLRMLIAALKNREIEKRGTGQSPTLTDEDVLSVLAKEVKKRREAAAVYATGLRRELQEKEIKEAKFIEKYLPTQMSEAEIEAVVKKVIDALPAQAGGATDFGTAMKQSMAELKNKADGKKVGEMVKKLLG